MFKNMLKIMNKHEISNFIIEELATMLNVEKEDLDADTNFLKIGLSSVQAIKIINKLRKKLNKEINPAVIFELKTVNDIAAHLAK